MIAFGWKTQSEVQPNSREQGFPAVNDPKLGANVALSLCQWASTLLESTCFSCERSYSNHVRACRVCLYHAWSCSSDDVGADETNPAASGSTARSSNLCSVWLTERSPEKERLAQCWHRTVSGVSYVADHSMRQLQLQAVTQWDSQWDSQWDLRVFFPNNAGLVPVLTEAPWKENGTGDSGATDPKWGLVCDFFMQGYKPALQIEQYSYQLPHSGGTYANVQTLPPFRLNWVCWLFEQLDS